MIWAFFASRAGKYTAAGIAIVLAVIAFLWWLGEREEAAVERDRAKAAQVIAKATERAETAAQATTAAIQNEVKHGNDEARGAAVNSADPLGVGIGKLRERQAGRNAAARRTD